MATTFKPPKISTTDFLILGAGVAGLRAALDLSQQGRVLMVAKGGPQDNNSFFAQGGVAVALSEEDDVDLHFTDTLKAGHQLCSRPATKVLVEEGPLRIFELIEWGANFDTIDGKLAFTKEGAHSRHRVLRAGGDATGSEMVRALGAKARELPNLTWMGNHFGVELLLQDGRCCGASVLNELTGEVQWILASAVLLATGGAGQVYARTTNPPNATGDGIAMAYRAGAVLEDMEFVQFHPTSLYLPSSPPFLLTEALRGEGGILRNNRCERFMKHYHRDQELAPRDIVSRAIWAEMQRTKARHVYLDVTHLGSHFLKDRFPTIYATCLRYDIDITEEWIPVSPSAHYFMGGVKTDLHGATSLPGLFAAGEVACSGVHGANRLGSNSLLEGLVFGYRAAQAASQFGSSQKIPTSPVEPVVLSKKRHPLSLQDIEKLRNSLRRLMWTKVGLVRTGDSLKKAIDQLEGWSRKLSAPPLTRSALETRNMMQVGLCIAEAANWRENSVGAHFREDFPIYKGTKWKMHSQRQMAPNAPSDTSRSSRQGARLNR
ncbi:MAG: L-aspartate oxidase [Nitrospira sp.]|nr:L-aspartate oxidase [Nitrospira sp.]MCA9475620.1 L-aspartate oxidase [Nitrospira sp.]MCA9480093.1 L-aspartate oxidase [Nitrospira sp.]MCB9710954.1 L-aspartate oxidase [Nitrospiraceae bacterium]